MGIKITGIDTPFGVYHGNILKHQKMVFKNFSTILKLNVF